MKRILTSVILVLLVLPVGGCVISVNDDGGWGDEGRDWRRRQEQNREAISHLELGRSRSEVISEMGEPDMTESFVRGGREFEVLLYRTHRVHDDGRTTREETTPLVFVDGELVGWGESAIRNALP